MSEEIAEEVGEDRRRIGEAVDPVEYAAMAGNELARILDAEIALDRRFGDVAEEAGDRDDAAGKPRPDEIHRRQIGPDQMPRRRRR